jgi:hypothetical protein
MNCGWSFAPGGRRQAPCSSWLLGAPEAIAALCGASFDGLAPAHAATETLAAEGLRVLGVARAHPRG